MGYAERGLAPRTLDEREQELLLRVTGEHARGFRDHVFFSAALGTALRLSELLALNVGQVYTPVGSARRRFPLEVFKRSNKDAKMQEVVIPDNLQYKLERYRGWKQLRGESIDDAAPLFVSRENGRLSPRQVRTLFTNWQERAGFDRRFSVHALRHTALSNLYRQTRDVRLVQRVARHKALSSTVIYTHVGDEEVLQAMRRQRC